MTFSLEEALDRLEFSAPTVGLCPTDSRGGCPYASVVTAWFSRFRGGLRLAFSWAVRPGGIGSGRRAKLRSLLPANLQTGPARDLPGKRCLHPRRPGSLRCGSSIRFRRSRQEFSWPAYRFARG